MVAKRSKNPQNLLKSRPPVVCVLGHVDHGKTTLLDYIRKTHVTSDESGGITQHIGAYQIRLKTKSSKLKADKDKEKKITFIDTPGHAAFCKIRSRGADVADVAILVVDGKEGLKPQTIECLGHIREAKIPFLVVVNKIDLAGSSVDMVKSQLAEKEILVEGYGGDVVIVPVSAKTGQGVDELLEMIQLLTEMQELKAELKADPEAIVIENKMDPRKGPTATVIVKKGILKLGDLIISGNVKGKIKAMFNDLGRKIDQAEPSQPVEILGFKGLPLVGNRVYLRDKKSAIYNRDEINIAKKEDALDFKQGEIHSKTDQKSQSAEKPQETVLKQTDPGDFQEDTKEEDAKDPGEKIEIILRADVAGSLEAIKSSFTDEVVLISEGIGEVTESDILLAASAKVVILAFRVNIPKQVKKLADYENVKILSYDIIYKLLEDIEKQVLKMIEPEIEEKVLAEAKVIAQFKIKGNHIAGCLIKKGHISIADKIHLKREGKTIADARVKFMQKNREDTKTAKEGEEVGLVLSPDIDFHVEDDIIAYN